MRINRQSDLAADILIATHTSVPVLISGPPDDTMRLAMAVAAGAFASRLFYLLNAIHIIV